MQAFFVRGCTGAYPRPELNVATGSSAINNDWVALSYWLRRSTSAGPYPGPVALPGPLNTDTAPPQISTVVATRLSFTSILVTLADQQEHDRHGLGCVDYWPYDAKMAIWLMVADRKWVRHLAFDDDQSAADVDPDSLLDLSEGRAWKQLIPAGSDDRHFAGWPFIGGSNGSTGKLVTNYGEWSFGTEVAPTPGFGGGP